MTIEKNNDEIILRMSNNVDLDYLQKLVDYIEYEEAISKSKATEEEIEELAIKSKSDWWQQNKDLILK